jgi:PAS domain S-box-containing protein
MTTHYSGEQSVTVPTKRFMSPFRLFVMIVVSIFISEALITFLLPHLPPLPGQVEALFDALLLSALVIPILYLCAFRPLVRHLTEQTQAEEALLKAHDSLERLVAERTVDMQRLNEQLQTEITERKQAEEQFRNLAEKGIEGIIIHRHGKPLFVNQAYATMLGYDSPDDILRMDDIMRHVFAPHEQERMLQYMYDRMRGDDAPTHYAYQGMRKDGSLVWLDNMVGAINWQGEPAIQSTIFDITDRKYAEEERQRLEDQLRQAQKMEAIGTLAGGIAHDFNNVLAAIIGYTELATYDIPQGSVPWHNLQEVLTASTRAKDLVQQIMTFSRQSNTERKPVRLAVLVKETLKLLRASLPTTIDIRYDFPDDTGMVFADPTQIHQIIMNLCTNAEQAMRETGGILEVRLEALEVSHTLVASHTVMQPGSYIRLTVRDTGHGMEPELLERIFEPFFTTKEVGVGTGMGLSVVHGIVTNHGGAITVQSTVGEGTTFEIYLSRIDEPTEKHTSSEEPIPHGQGRILFVDDEVMLTGLVQTTLERLGYDVISRTSSIEALEAFRAMPHRFDLVITDQTMPNMTGEHLARELRRIRPDVPIILCTGFSHVTNAEKSQMMGIDAFCMKPFVSRDLAVTIQQVLAKRSEWHT